MTSAPAGSGWTARPALPSDHAEQARLFNLCFGKQKTAETFAWKYDQNPHGPAIARLACAADGRVLGGYAYTPRRFRLDGEPVTLMQASDAMTAPEARGQRIFTGLDDLVCAAAGQSGVPLAFAYSGRRSLNGFLRNGWQLIGHAPVWRRRFRSRRSLLRLGRIGPLAALLAPLFDIALRQADRRRLGPQAGGRVLERIARFDEAADQLFEELVPPRGLIGERRADWLNWRYIDTPTRRQECFALRRGGAAQGPLDGWLVAEFVDGHAFLVDHLARDAESAHTLLLAFTAAAHARGMEEATALLFEHHPAVPLLRRLAYRGPRQRRPFRDIFPFIVRNCSAGAAAEAGRKISTWHLADGDRDAEHLSA
ncbi:MAG: GNAT family N-acetyltransferase [Planctomycetota bacterium]